jgi:hypothetical protein
METHRSINLTNSPERQLYLVSVILLDLLSDLSAQAIEVLLLDSSIDATTSEDLDKVTTYLKLQFFKPSVYPSRMATSFTA